MSTLHLHQINFARFHLITYKKWFTQFTSSHLNNSKQVFEFNHKYYSNLGDNSSSLKIKAQSAATYSLQFSNFWFKINLRGFCNSSKKVDTKVVEKENPKDNTIKGVFKENYKSKERLKLAIRDYGSIALVFHVSISLMSLGICYLLVKSSLPIENLLYWLNAEKYFSSSSQQASVNFVVAYALHKAVMPFRIFLTVTCVPMIVKVLRKKNILKQPTLNNK